MDLVPVPEPVVRTASAAIAERNQRGAGGTARGVVIATALSTGHVHPREVDELRDWHDANPGAVSGDASTLLGGLYGGAEARTWAEESRPEPEPEIIEVVVTAAASPTATKLARMSRVLNRTNQGLRTRLHAAAQVAFEEALRQAGAKVIARAKGQRAKATAAAAVDAHGITAAVCAAVGVTEQELLDRRFDALAAAAVGWITVAELRKLRATAAALGLDGDDLEETYRGEIDARAIAAAGFLVAGLQQLARASLAGGPEPAAMGELSGPVPFTLVRDAWNIAATGSSVPKAAESGVGPVGVGKLPRPERGQTITEQLLGDTGTQVQLRSTWAVGAPARPFEPHQALDGVSWVDTQPPELDWDPGEFPYVAVLEPGDHDGCECELLEEYEAYASADLVDSAV